MTHDELLNDLAGHLKGPDIMLWRDMQLGPAGSIRPDVYTLRKSFRHPTPRVFEVKVSVSDFRADVTAGKWQSYLDVACSVTFAFPAGLVQDAAVPAQCGILTRSERGWHARRRPTQTPVSLHTDVLLKLLIDGIEREGLAHRHVRYGDWLRNNRFLHRYGEIAAQYVADAESFAMRMEAQEDRRDAVIRQANKDATQIRESAGEAWNDLRQALGMAEDAEVWAVRNEVRRLRETVRGRAPDVELALRDARDVVRHLEAALGVTS